MKLGVTSEIAYFSKGRERGGGPIQESGHEVQIPARKPGAFRGNPE
jgi:hypothetical protein